MNKLDTGKPVFFIAFKKRDEEGNIVFIKITDKEYYTVQEKAESDMKMLINQKHFKASEIEIIKLWFCLKMSDMQ